MAITRALPARAARQPVQLGIFGIRSWRKTRLLLAICFAAISIFPMLFMASLSFQPQSDVFSGTPVLVPAHPTTSNYVQAWTENSFGRFFGNSLYVSAGTVVVTVVLASLAAYAFARFRFPLREPIFFGFLASLAVPAVLLIIPQYLLMTRLHLVNSLNGLVLIYVSQNLPFAIFLLRGFFEAIPRELEESFRVEGAGNVKVLTKLIAPLSVPALATVAMFTFNAAWDEFIVALTLINSPSQRTLPIGLALFIGAHTTAWGALFAGSMIATVPSVAVYLMAQRWFRHGISLGGLR